MYSVNLQKLQIIRAQANEYIENAVAFNQEEASVYFTASPELAMQNSL